MVEKIGPRVEFAHLVIFHMEITHLPPNIRKSQLKFHIFEFDSAFAYVPISTETNLIK